MAPHFQKILFQFNPLAAPRFEGTWERKAKSVKAALKVTLREQSIPKPVLQALLVEGVLNAKPLGCVSAEAADLDPVTLNMLLVERQDSSLPRALYDNEGLLGKRRRRRSQVLADHFSTSVHLTLSAGPTGSLEVEDRWQGPRCGAGSPHYRASISTHTLAYRYSESDLPLV